MASPRGFATCTASSCCCTVVAAVESKLSLLVVIETKSGGCRAQLLFRPFTREMWLFSLLLAVFVAFVLFLTEHSHAPPVTIRLGLCVKSTSKTTNGGDKRVTSDENKDEDQREGPLWQSAFCRR